MKRLIALALCALLLPLSAHAWWNEAWTIRKQITLDAQPLGLAAEVSDAPVLVRLSTGTFDFLSTMEGGADIRFVAEDDKTELPHAIERFDVLNELAFIWVRVPKVAPGNVPQHIWLYYGNQQPPARLATPVYDAAQLATFHLSEEAGLPQDSSAGAHHARTGTLTYVASGLMGGGARMAAEGGIELGSAALQAASALSFSAWFKPDTAEGELLKSGGLTLTLEGGIPVLQVGEASTRAPSPLAPDSWQHLAVTQGASGAVLYVNGKPVGTLGAPYVAAADLLVGAGLRGEIDEIQLASEVRSADWIALQAGSQGPSSLFMKFNEEETTEGGQESGYFIATMKNLTIDGWVVVVICVFMFFIALYVMFSKGRFIARQSRSNEGFSEAFDQLAAALLKEAPEIQGHIRRLDHLSSRESDFGDSSLHRIYQVGTKELVGRFNAAQGSQEAMPKISANAMAAVRASLDAQLTRERQRLDRGMVLLTIAISGGPFLGLLGTVVGVMITFAAIAAAGDVNVNAIAPGIAAALVATVAGLGVAIPALFGYNYLQTRVKEIAVDMNVFVDEFVTKMAENYGS